MYILLLGCGKKGGTKVAKIGGFTHCFFSVAQIISIIQLVMSVAIYLHGHINGLNKGTYSC